MLVIEPQYFPPITGMALLAEHKTILIDGYEHFVKRSYRNRCYICGANGSLRLSVPLERGKHQRRAMKDIMISYEFDWQKLHWQSFCSAYRRSPYFEFYEDEFYEVFNAKRTLLMELNMDMLNWVSNAMDLGLAFSLTNNYKAVYEHDFEDGRNTIMPMRSKEEPVITTPAYQQVYANKMNFIPNLSVLDLLFNLGPKRGKAYLLNLPT